MKNKLTKTIVMIVFVVFISLFLNVGNVSAWDSVPDDGYIHYYTDSGTVCWYGNGNNQIQVEVNNSGIGIYISYGPWSKKFIENWEHDKGKHGAVKVGFRGVEYYHANNKSCPKYVAKCHYYSEDRYYVVNTENQLDSLDDKCYAEAVLTGSYSFSSKELVKTWQVPVNVPDDAIIVEEEPTYECAIVNGEYYDGSGNKVSQSAYEESCATPEINEGIVNPLEDNSDSFSCGDGYLTDIPGSLLRVTSLLYTLFQVVIPVILVIICSIDLIKAMAGQKEDEIKKGQHLLIKRLIQAIIIFFVFAIVKFLVSVVSENSSSVIDCVNCFIDGKDSDSCV